MNKRNISAANFRGALVATLLWFLSCDGRAAATTNQQELASANAAFAFNLLQQIATGQPGTNIFISPYSVSTALQMVSIGAGGSTRTEMQQVLGTIDMESAALNAANKEIGAIIDSKNANFVLTAANAIWYRDGTPIERAFIKDNEQFFGARVEALNFNNPASVNVINAWASDETRGKIDRIVSPPIDSKTSVFLANAVYFLGKWEIAFDAKDTKDQPFYLDGGGQATLPMMEQSGSFSYSATNGYQAVRLPYKGGDLAMYVFLPGPGTNLAEFLGAMNGSWWQQSIQVDFSEQKGTLVLPKFDLNYSIDLVSPLQALGLTNAFTLDADFSNMSSDPLYISDVKQQAVVEVDEAGTEAAAVTTVTVDSSAMTPDSPIPFQMTVDRPFLFFIQDRQAATILFMGMVFDP